MKRHSFPDLPKHWQYDDDYEKFLDIFAPPGKNLDELELLNEMDKNDRIFNEPNSDMNVKAKIKKAREVLKFLLEDVLEVEDAEVALRSARAAGMF